MEREHLSQMHKNLDTFMASGMFDGRKAVIFGSNEPAERIMEYLGKNGIPIYGLVDNNVNKDGTLLNGISVTLPGKLLTPKLDDAVILIASRYYSEMAAQLEDMGYEEGKQVLKAVELSSYSSHSVSWEEFVKRCETVEYGEGIFRRIYKKYHEPDKVFVYPFPALGETYIGMSLTERVKERDGLERVVFVTALRPAECVGYLFGYENDVCLISKEEMRALMQYLVFTDMADGKAFVVHHRFPYTCRVGEVGNFRGISFLDIYRYGVFGLDEGLLPTVPHLHRNDERSREYTERLFEDNNLPEKKTVILLPYANTASSLDYKFWVSIAGKLKEMGYTVCTNSVGEHEPVIEGTKGLFFDLRFGLEVVERAGVVIGLRSGLFDVLSTAKAVKVVLYPDRVYGDGSFFDFYSLNGNGLCDDAVEMVVSDDEEEVVKQVLKITEIV